MADSTKKIDWTKYFDRIWCINFIPYRSRHDAIKREFDRIGISDHPNFMWNYTFDSPLFGIGMAVLESNPSLGRLLNATELKCWMGHYSCIKKSEAFDDSRILIIEDDSRFLKDLDKMEEILDNMPKDCDIILFDHFANVSKMEYESYKSRKINDFYSEYDTLDSCGCYSLSREAISVLSTIYEHKVIPADNYTSKLQLPLLKKCFSLKNLSCQATYVKSMSVNNAGTGTIHRVYAKSGIIYSEYNMNDGKPYDYGSFIVE